jgi:heterodisulfide reductase subunit A
VHLHKKPRFIDEALCTNCGQCTEYCPLLVPDAYEEDLSLVKNLHIPFLQAVPAVPYIDPSKCLYKSMGTCQICTSACQRNAIDFGQKEESLTLDVGAVILAPGYSAFDATRIPAYGYGEYSNVVSGLEFERICCASGPSLGGIQRPSDLRKPQRVAIILCVGSRDKTCGNAYCSGVCCKYGVKDAIVALEHEPDLDITIFYMDMRMYGKGFETFYERAKEAGVKFVRSRVSEVREDDGTCDLTLKYVLENGELRNDTFNLVVLAHGLEAPKDNSNLALAAGIGLNAYDFCKTDLFSPLNTTRDGIFVAGAFQGPKSIPESVCQAGGAAASAAELIASVRGTLVTEKTYPDERALDDESKVGVFVCHCGKNIAGVVDVEAVSAYAETLDDVAMVERNLYSCSSDTQELIAKTIAEKGLNRVVVAACTPRTHEPLFQDTLREAGLNKCLVEMVNIRDQCSWVHAHEKEAATQKAKDLVRMAVAKARRITPLPEATVEVNPKSLVLGGGLSGMTSALSLARQGFECYLVERQSELGGSLRQTHFTLEGSDPQEHLKGLVEEITTNERIHVFTDTTVDSIDGFVGNFRTLLSNGTGDSKDIEHGTIIVATGATALEPETYLYGQNEKVVLQQALEEKLAKGQLDIKALNHVVMIQCVGSRDEDHPYCSAVCCNQAIKNALKIKELSPDTDVTILYRDVMSYGFSEDYYSLARDKGIIFIRYEVEQKPQVEAMNGKVQVTVKDPLMGQNIVMDADLLALSTAMVPYENQSLIEKLKVPLSSDGFFLESHAQLKPVDSYVDGIYLCGKAQFPKPGDECIAQAKAAAAKAAILMAKGYVTAEPIVATCDTDACIGCGICAHLCPYSAIKMKKVGKLKKAEMVAAACKGCGVCASYCPTRAIATGRFTDEQIEEQIAAFGAGG